MRKRRALNADAAPSKPESGRLDLEQGDTLKGDIVAEGDGRRVAERERVERSVPLASLIQVSHCIIRPGLFTVCLLFIQL